MILTLQLFVILCKGNYNKKCQAHFVDIFKITVLSSSVWLYSIIYPRTAFWCKLNKPVFLQNVAPIFLLILPISNKHLGAITQTLFEIYNMGCLAKLK